MSAATRARRVRAPPFLEPPGYARHRPEATLLYQLVERHYPAFREMRAEAGRPLPDYIEQEFDAYLKCGRLEEGFLRVRCETCHAEKLVAFSCKKRRFCPSCAARRMAETAADVGHVGDGNFHMAYLIDPQIPAERETAERLSSQMVALALRLEGTCSGEHGIGLHKQGFLIDEAGVGAVALMRSVKAALDPHNIMNPGKFFS